MSSICVGLALALALPGHGVAVVAPDGGAPVEAEAVEDVVATDTQASAETDTQTSADADTQAPTETDPQADAESPAEPELPEEDRAASPEDAKPVAASETPASPPGQSPPSEPTPPYAPTAQDYGPDGGFAPGGYYGRGEILEREPPDGHRHIVIGSILVPLGTIATVSSAAGIYLTVPAHCAERLPSIGIEVEDSERCNSVFAFNVVRTSYGALMLISGSVILGIGLVQRHKHKTWRESHGLRAFVTPARGGAAAGLRLRF